MLEKLSTLSPQKFGEERARKLGQRLDAEWQTTDARGRVSFEQQTSLILDGRLYTFSLRTDEEHYEQYRFDFEEMLQTMKLSPPEVDLEQVDGGYWMQREFRFALRLPDGWQPAFGGSDKALLFATGKRRDALTDQLQVSASAARRLALEKLRDTLPVEIAAADPGAKATCKIVPQGGGSAVEMLVETHRGETAVCMLERRFHGAQRNYEVRITCESAEFKAREADLRKALDSFREVAETPKKDIF